MSGDQKEWKSKVWEVFPIGGRGNEKSLLLHPKMKELMFQLVTALFEAKQVSQQRKRKSTSLFERVHRTEPRPLATVEKNLLIRSVASQ